MAEKKAEESLPGGVSASQAKQAKEQGSATGVRGLRGEEGGLQGASTGSKLPLADLDETERTDSDRAVNPSPNVGAVLNPPINPVRDEDRDKPVYIPAPGSQNRELRKNLEKHASTLTNVFEDQDK